MTREEIAERARLLGLYASDQAQAEGNQRHVVEWEKVAALCLATEMFGLVVAELEAAREERLAERAFVRAEGASA